MPHNLDAVPCPRAVQQDWIAESVNTRRARLGAAAAAQCARFLEG